MAAKKLNKSVINFLTKLAPFYGEQYRNIDFSADVSNVQMRGMPPIIEDFLKHDDLSEGLTYLILSFKSDLESADENGFSNAEIASINEFIVEAEECLRTINDVELNAQSNTQSIEENQTENKDKFSSNNELILSSEPETFEQMPQSTFVDVDDSYRNILHFGPFHDLIAKIGRNLPLLSEDPTCTMISNHFVSFSRDKLHDLVMESPSVMEENNIGFEQRMELLVQLKNEIYKEHNQVFSRYSKEQVLKLDMYTATINDLIDAEFQKNKILRNTPEEKLTFIESLFKRVTNNVSHQDKLADIHRLRSNRESNVLKNLNSLADIAKKFRDNAGNEEWEKTEGKKLAGQASQLSKSTKKILDKVIGTVDERGFGKRFASISKSFNDSSLRLSDKALKDRMLKLSESMMAFVRKILTLIGIREPKQATQQENVNSHSSYSPRPN